MSPAPYRPAGQHVRPGVGDLEAQGALVARLEAQLQRYGARLAAYIPPHGRLTPGFTVGPGGRRGAHVRYIPVAGENYGAVWGARRDPAHDARMRQAVEAAAGLLGRDGWRLSTIEPAAPRPDSYAPGFFVEAGPLEDPAHG